MADFVMVSRRSLDEFEQRVFRTVYLLGADWRLCCRRMKIEKGDFFHVVYEIEQKLGRIFAELRPYPLFPLDEYFAGLVVRKPPTAADTVSQLQSELEDDDANYLLSA